MRKLIDNFIYYNEVVLAKSYNTVRSYKRDLIQFQEYLENNENILDFSKVEIITIRSYVIYLTKEYNISKRSISRKLSAIKSFYNYLLINEYIHENKIQHISMPKFEKTIPTYLTKDEMDKIRNVIDTTKIEGLRDRAMIETLYSSGVRSQELLDLTEYSIDFLEMQIKVIGKGNKERITFISPASKKYILEYIERKKKEYKNYEKDILFANYKGKRLTTRALRKIIEKYSNLANISKEVSPHTFRHSFATELLNNQVDIKYVQELLGHTSLMTTQVYTHVSKKLLKDIYMKVHPLTKNEKESEK